MKKGILLGIVLIVTLQISAKQYFISSSGYDTNNGTFEDPFWSIQKAQETANAGDTVYIRGGNYVLSQSDVSKVESDLFACISYMNLSGEAGRTRKYWAYPGETPVFDFSAIKPANQRVVGMWVSGSYIHIKGIEMIGIQITITTHTESYCVYSRGSNNIFENMSFHDNKGTGLRHVKGGDNLFLNCDAYNNHDDVSENQLGGNTDGFGCHPSDGGTGNVFRGCRAWFNSDDGFDFIRAKEAVVLDSCQALYNGYSPSFASLGDGNGFKAGGYAYDEESKLPNPIPSHTIRFCLAVNNKAGGFYSNHHLTGNAWYNNSAYRNRYNYNMVNRESPQSDNINVDGYDHILKNNLGYKARSIEVHYMDEELCILANNYFDLDVTITDDDFVSLDEDLLTQPRNEDGTLPEIDFMRLAAGSDLIDAGVDIGFSFSGVAPDLGAYEHKTTTAVNNLSRNEKPVFYPNPAKDVIYISALEVEEIRVLDISGRVHQVVVFDNKIDISHLASGIYIISYEAIDGQRSIRKIVVEK